jgi:hypothetical protein
MAKDISISDYCAHPEDYKNSPELNDDTRKIYDEFCTMQKQAQNAGLPSGKDWGKDFGYAVLQMMVSMVTPPGIAIMSGVVGGPILMKAIKAWVGQWIKKGISEEGLKAAEEFISKGGEKYIANSCLMADDFLQNTAFLSVDVAEVAGVEAGGRLATVYVFRAAELLGEFVSYVGIVMMVLQVIGMIFDSWDPCKLDTQLTADILDSYCQQFDGAFRASVLAVVGGVKDSYGRVSVPGNWPVEYYAEEGILQNKKEDYYGPIRTRFMMEYLGTLEINSDGLPIDHSDDASSLITSSHLSEASQRMLAVFGDSNTVVENWIYKWWPVVLGILIILIVIFLVIRKR